MFRVEVCGMIGEQKVSAHERRTRAEVQESVAEFMCSVWGGASFTAVGRKSPSAIEDEQKTKPHQDFRSNVYHSSRPPHNISALKTASTFVTWLARLDVPNPDQILDSSMWHLL